MTTFKKKLLAITVALPILAISLSSQAAMTTYMEKALIDICKAAKSDSILLLKSTAKSYRLKTKTVVLKLICNGENVISFAQSNGAEKTAAKLQRSLEDVSITDIASLTKLKVTF